MNARPKPDLNVQYMRFLDGLNAMFAEPRLRMRLPNWEEGRYMALDHNLDLKLFVGDKRTNLHPAAEEYGSAYWEPYFT